MFNEKLHKKREKQKKSEGERKKALQPLVNML